MSRHLYEIVPGIELQPGDLIRARPTDEPDGIVGEQVADVYRLRPDLKVFRRIPDAEDPQVLRRALENELTPPRLKRSDAKFLVEMAIDEARKELESEDASDQAK